MSIYQALQEEHRPQLKSLLAQAFSVPEAFVDPWINRSGLPDWRGVTEGERLQSCLVLVPGGQWYNGQQVSMVGLAGVAVSAVDRSRGAGKRLMRGFLEEAFEQGTALSILYGSTTGFYRSVGYERAGSVFSAEVKIREIPRMSPTVAIRELDWERDSEKLKRFVLDHANHHGALVRETYLWSRVRQLQTIDAEGFGLFGEGGLEGYFYVVEKAGTLDERALQVTDFLFSTPGAVDGFLRYLYSQRSLCSTATLFTVPNSSVLLRLPDRWNYNLSLHEHWMLRIVHLKNALESRGYPVGVSGQISLSVTDPVLSENSGSWLLEIDNGRATLRPHSQGEVYISITSLAALYSGFLSATELSRGGYLTGGGAQECDFLTRAFGPEAKLTELF